MKSAQTHNSKKTWIRQAVRRLLAGDDGAALVEFTILAPMLVVMSIYTMDFGVLFVKKMEMQNGAQAGAQWAIANRIYNSSDIQIAGQNATTLPTTSVDITPSPFCGCSMDSKGKAIVTPLALSLTACTPNSTCNTNGLVGTYVTVAAAPTNPYTSFIAFGGTRLWGGVSKTPNITATTTVRIQ
jgi:Flp pilus assembly protein TadG